MTRKHGIDLLIGLAITALVLLGIEVFLGAAGLGEVPEEANWSRGFDASARYLVPVAGAPGTWETRFKHETRKEVVIPPKGEKTRVLTFGGSNTAGFDTNYLTKVLEKEIGEGVVECFNLGRPGYGSERVKFIFQQAVEELDPDVVVIYAGHNEFVERGFQMDLQKASAGDWAAAPLEVARRTRLFNSIVEHYASQRESPQKEPEAWDNEYSKFADITFDRTLEYFRAYEENIRTMCREARSRDIEVVLCTIVHNRMSAPFSSTFPHDLDEATIEEFEDKRRAALKRLPEYMDVLLPKKEQERIHGMEYSVRPLSRDREVEGLGYAEYEGWRDATGFLKDREPGLPNPMRWSSTVFRFFRALLRFQNRDLDERGEEAVLRAERSLEEALAIYPEHPRALFELALTKHLLGRPPESVMALLIRAADLDRAPRKGSNRVNEIIRGIARDIDGVVLADIDLSFQECLPNGLIGWEWMADHCHLNKGGRDAIVELFAKAILENCRDAVAPPSSNN